MTVSITEKRRVALAYDGTEDARKLFDWTIKNIVRAESDHLILLSAVQRSSTQNRHHAKSEIVLNPTEEIPKEIEPTARERLTEMSNQLNKSHISSEEHILWGDAKALLPRYTQSHHVDLLIMGSRGLGAMKSVFLGSVSDVCLKECPCPVLVVRNTTI
ncbi:hypothetical protein BY458DRAFT_109282 [Sporodiniella umbellata]|nr:hypothetical protein BY458DRAFT_109282 [Sporodiniella umbellata]